MQKLVSDINLKIEELKIKHEFDTYLETISYFLSYETDQEPDRIAKCLNKKIIEEIHKEANEYGLLKTQEQLVTVL